MMKRLILIRHAKSSWDAPFDDHSRTLNDRGRRNATRLGAWLSHHGHVPDHIYCSDAARTRETTDRIISAAGGSSAITLKDTMYHASSAALMTVLRKTQGDTIALVAHNPGIAFFAEEILASAPDHPRFMDYPTCATLVCDLPIEKWADAVASSAHVVDFVVPKDLSD
jgi:phosphohistidine phosphatase